MALFQRFRARRDGRQCLRLTVHADAHVRRNMLYLKDVTLVCYEAKAHTLMQRALEQIRSNVNFVDEIVHLQNEDTPKLHSAQTLWYDIPLRVQTSHMLNVEWDSGIVDASAWDANFLEYDYIGAPWPWHKDWQVGNGGFSLRSTKLMRYLGEHRDEFPLHGLDDDLLCRVYRPRLQERGFVWAPTSHAERFSFERGTPRKSFGFHGLYNFPYVFQPDEVLYRMALAPESVRAKSEWHELLRNAAMVA